MSVRRIYPTGPKRPDKSYFIKPCKCGSRRVDTNWKDAGADWFVWCFDCLACSPGWCADEKEAIFAWNRGERDIRRVYRKELGNDRR